MKVPLPRDRALAGTSREVTSKFLKELEGEGVWLFNYLKIIAFLTLSMIIKRGKLFSDEASKARCAIKCQ